MYTNYNPFTIFLNLFPLSSKFLNKSKLALAGENNTTCPLLETLFATATVSAKLSQGYIFKSLSCFIISSCTTFNILFAVAPNSIKCFTLFTIYGASGE